MQSIEPGELNKVHSKSKKIVTWGYLGLQAAGGGVLLATTMRKNHAKKQWNRDLTT